MILAAIHFKRLNMTLSEFFRVNLTALNPFENEGSRDLIIAIKDGNNDMVSYLLRQNKFLVHNFDFVNK
jgi:hypothetical protein